MTASKAKSQSSPVIYPILRATRARGQLGASDLKAGSNGSDRHDVRAAIWRGSTYPFRMEMRARCFSQRGRLTV